MVVNFDTKERHDIQLIGFSAEKVEDATVIYLAFSLVDACLCPHCKANKKSKQRGINE